MHTREGHAAAGRLEMAIVGVVAGLAIWALIEKAHDIVSHPLAYLALTGFVSGFFAVLLGLSGPHRIARAALPALGLSAVAAALLTLSGTRFDTLDAFGDAQHPIVAWAIFLTIGTPFVATTLRDHHSLRDYGHLFDVSWGILVRYSAAWLFVGLFWAVVFLSGALLEIVGLTLIEDLIEIDGVPFLISGAALGLGLSVVHELRDYISPFLVMRLLRLLVPVVLVVVLIFVGAALWQEPGELFGSLSRAATLLTVGLAMIALISVALDRGDADAVQTPWMRAATASLALLLPVLACLAGYALWLRISQYGWTPERLAAAGVAGIMAAYAICYAGSVMLRGPWMARIRQANIAIAVGILGVAALWQTPLLNAERIATASQVTRVLEGAVSPKEAALWEMRSDWGRAGLAGLERMSREGGAEASDLASAIARAQSSDTYWEYQQAFVEDQSIGPATRLFEQLTVLPEGIEFEAELLSGIALYRLNDWADLCEAALDPKCVLVLGDFRPTHSGREGILFLPAIGQGIAVFSVHEIDNTLSIGENLSSSDNGLVTEALLRDIVDGNYQVAPSRRRSLWVGEFELFPDF